MKQKKTSNSDRILANLRSKFLPLFTGIYSKLFTENIRALNISDYFVVMLYYPQVQTGITKHIIKTKKISSGIFLPGIRDLSRDDWIK